MNWTPYQIEIMLHFHYSPVPWPRANAPIFPDTLRDLEKMGLLKASPTPNCYETTDRGKALVEMWCATPIPEMRYVDPRFDFAISLANGADKP